MSSLAGLIRHVLSEYKEAKRAAIQNSNYSDFEIDFELRFVLFLTALIDGQTNGAEKRFIEAVRIYLGWSEFYEKLLTERIHCLPAYDLEQLIASRATSQLGEIFFKTAATLAAYDNDLSSDEILFLNNIEGILLSHDQDKAEIFINDALALNKRPPILNSIQFHKPEETVQLHTPKPAHQEVEECLEELNQLVGLENVKEEVEKLVRYLEIQAHRREHQLAQSALTLHMVFTGNPGTGKTTVARIVAKVFRALNILKKGHLVETDRMGLVGQYVGHTSRKTDEVVNKALDGVLFIDEAYSLVKEDDTDFGHDAINTLVKRMEDYRDRLLVIVAGYPNEMRSFIETNPGLKSRFSTHIHFPNYTPAELQKILDIFCTKNEYRLEADSNEYFAKLFHDALLSDLDNFGNGRYIRNLFEQALRNQALRLSLKKDPLNRDDLMLLKANDFMPGRIKS